MPERTITFVTGGAASGKSRLAESLVRATGKTKVYIATLQPFDAEMWDKVATHQDDRGADWTTIEAPIEVAEVIAQTAASDVILLDCVTLWLSNVLLSDRDITAYSDALLTAVNKAVCDIVIVSNEVGMGIVPDNALSRQFRNAQGRLNQQIAARADNVITVISGLPLVLKGTCNLLDQT